MSERDSAIERLEVKLAFNAKVPVIGHARRAKSGRQQVDPHSRRLDLKKEILKAGGEVPPADGKAAKAPKTDVDRAKTPEGVKSGSGTREDPYVTDDIDVATKLIYEDRDTPDEEARWVKLEQEHQVSTLLDKLKAIGDDAKARGEKAPLYNLCRISVPGTNLFCHETKGIPRTQMPQLGGVPTPGSDADDATRFPKDKKGEVNLGDAFVEHLRTDENIGVDVEEVRADFLKATQTELDGTKVAGMMAAADAGKFDIAGETIFVTDDDYVVDGHHRWAAAVANEYGGRGTLNLKVRRIHTDIATVLRLANSWTQEMGMAQRAA
jgi:hypothetical protein